MGFLPTYFNPMDKNFHLLLDVITLENRKPHFFFSFVKALQSRIDERSQLGEASASN